MAPLSYEPSVGREAAFRRLRSSLLARPGVNIVSGASADYLHAELPSLEIEGAVDDAEFRFLPEDALVAFRIKARQTVPMKPFCTTSGCINGNAGQRRQLELVQQSAGLQSQDGAYEREKRWVPIFLHGG
jgi:hypothetical protein